MQKASPKGSSISLDMELITTMNLEDGLIIHKDEYHCWWFHCLYDHNHLEFSDILKIGSIWSDIKVYYQYNMDVLK